MRCNDELKQFIITTLCGTSSIAGVLLIIAIFSALVYINLIGNVT